jgi:hypothetical protein
METTSDDARAALAEIEQGRDAVWVPRKIPSWYWWSSGLAVGGFWALQDIDNKVVVTISAVAYVVALSTIMGLYFRKTGFRPRLSRRGAPTALRRHQWGIGAVMIGLMGAAGATVWVSGVAHPWLVIGIVGFLVMVTVGPLTERWYAKAWASWKASQ